MAEGELESMIRKISMRGRDSGALGGRQWGMRPDKHFSPYREIRWMTRFVGRQV